VTISFYQRDYESCSVNTPNIESSLCWLTIRCRDGHSVDIFIDKVDAQKYVNDFEAACVLLRDMIPLQAAIESEPAAVLEPIPEIDDIPF
jgi:hypothetical protein